MVPDLNTVMRTVTLNTLCSACGYTEYDVLSDCPQNSVEDNEPNILHMFNLIIKRFTMFDELRS